MKSLTRYALANTVARAKVSEILTQQDLDGMARAESFEEAWGVLTKTPYGQLLPAWAGQDVYEIDRLLHLAAGRRFLSVVRALNGKPGKAALLLLSRWDLDALEFTLRLWHGKDPADNRATSYAAFVHVLPMDALLAAENLVDMARILPNTPFAQALISCSRTYAERRSLFYVETALEKDYYRRLLEAIKALGGQDARDGQTMIGAEIDLLNLVCLARLLNYHKIPPENAGEFAIPGPTLLSKQLQAPGMNTESFNAIYAHFGTAHFGVNGQQLEPLDSISLLENALNEILVRLARHALAGYPFSITSVLAFYILTRVELRNLRSAFVSKKRRPA